MAGNLEPDDMNQEPLSLSFRVANDEAGSHPETTTNVEQDASLHGSSDDMEVDGLVHDHRCDFSKMFRSEFIPCQIESNPSYYHIKSAEVLVDAIPVSGSPVILLRVIDQNDTFLRAQFCLSERHFNRWGLISFQGSVLEYDKITEAKQMKDEATRDLLGVRFVLAYDRRSSPTRFLGSSSLAAQMLENCSDVRDGYALLSFTFSIPSSSRGQWENQLDCMDLLMQTRVAPFAGTLDSRGISWAEASQPVVMDSALEDSFDEDDY